MGTNTEVPLQRVGLRRWRGSRAIDAPATVVPVLLVDGEHRLLPPLASSYAEEHRPLPEGSGRARLESVARRSGGQERLSLGGAFTPPRDTGALRSASGWLLLLAMLLWVGELLLDRLRLFPAPRRAQRASPGWPAVPRFRRGFSSPPAPGDQARERAGPAVEGDSTKPPETALGTAKRRARGRLHR